MNAAARSPAGPGEADVLRHLGESLREQWRRYRQRLKRCQRRFSEEAVHDSRVETRRLLATVELLAAFVRGRELRQARRALKSHLDSFDRLRDTQVQLASVALVPRDFSARSPFRAWLLKREARYIRETRKAVRKIRTRRLGRRLRAFEKELRRFRRNTPIDRAFGIAQDGIQGAFARVALLCRRVNGEDTATIHRTRIAFKRFRYMVEALAPLLPSVTEEHRKAMRGYQSMMGDIQDVEVLLAALGRYINKSGSDADAQRLRAEFERRRGQLIRVYLNAADGLRKFWPPAGCAAGRNRKS
jgi:CHAD domain-containing protein